ncbi:BTB/POZ domain-containing protein At5g47800 isoform X2 [Apium graveolens]|uniref:BTB/POZ domain-containing protein At5g47800 isoform X2 n=1 Tax=Apium graveolens TaxID=4045 RepID=UPI003D7A0C98
MKMKFMKLGTRPDAFYTEEATRKITSDIPSNLTVLIDDISYHVHTFVLLPKCGLLQRLCSSHVRDSENVMVLELHEIPGGGDAFELCAKFCYGIMTNFSAHNIVSALCAAHFLQMTESVEKGNFALKLEIFFSSCILEGWKDSIVALQTTGRLSECAENLGIIRRCIDSIVDKILTPPSKVTWPYTYTRPGYSEKRHQNVPKDWWTEDISEVDIDLFRCIITTVRSANMLPLQLIGEALHVYACCWLPDIKNISPTETSDSRNEESLDRKRRILVSIASMIPEQRGSVSVGFLLRLSSLVKFLGVSPVIKAELIKRSSLQLEDAVLNDLLLPSHSCSEEDGHFYDINLVGAVLESYLREWKRQSTGGNTRYKRSIMKVGRLIDLYLQVIARDVNTPVQKFLWLAESLPEIARPNHDDLYKAINIYLEEHPDLSKQEKKRLCRILDCQRFSPEVCAHAVRNERLPLRTVVQLLYFEQERAGMATSTDNIKKQEEDAEELPPTAATQQALASTSAARELSKLKLGLGKKYSEVESTRSSTPGTRRAEKKLLIYSSVDKVPTRRSKTPGTGDEREHQKLITQDQRVPVEAKQKMTVEQVQERNVEIRHGTHGNGFEPKKTTHRKQR